MSRPTRSRSRPPAARTSSAPCSRCSSRSASGSWSNPAWSGSAGAAARSPTAPCGAPEPAPPRSVGSIHPEPSKENPTVAQMYYDNDADLSVITNRQVAVIGYGSQGHAHALSLRDSGVDVRVGLPETSKSRAKAESEGLRVVTPAQAVEESDVIMLLTPDHVQRHV